MYKLVEGKQDPRGVLMDLVGDSPSKGVLVRRLRELPRDQLKGIVRREVR